MKTNATIQQMEKALDRVNVKYDGNVEFARFECTGKTINFTLKVKDSSGKGARRGFSGKKMINACWHVHGDFMDALFADNPDCYVKSLGNTITAQSGNWEDSNIGNMASPLYYSEACLCNETGLSAEGV